MGKQLECLRKIDLCHKTQQVFTKETAIHHLCDQKQLGFPETVVLIVRNEMPHALKRSIYCNLKHTEMVLQFVTTSCNAVGKNPVRSQLHV